MNTNVEFYEAFAVSYEDYYKDVDAPQAVSQWLTALEAQQLIPTDLARSKNPPSLLDVGCGPGWHLRAWQRAHFNVAGLDASPRLLRLASRNAHAGLDTDIPIYCADITDQKSLSSLAGTFDVAVSHFNFLNLFSPDEIGMAFSGCASVLRSNGLWVSDLSLGPDSDINIASHQPARAVLGWRRDVIKSQDSVHVQWERDGVKLKEKYWFHSMGQLVDSATVAGFRLAGLLGWDLRRSVFTVQSQETSSRVLLIFARR